MISSKEEYKKYLNEDARALGKTYSRPHLVGDEIWKFQRLMRLCEYSMSWHGLGRIVSKLIRLRYHRYSIKLNYSIPIGVFGPGLALVHLGPVVVSQHAKVGKNCRLQTMTVIGATNGEKSAPTIGDNVYIGVGAKIIGDISIADDVAIGAGAVVVKTISESAITVGGIPAKRISNNSSRMHLR